MRGSGLTVFLTLLSLQTCCIRAGKVAQTPPMGYNTWNCFGVFINEGLIKTTADLMVKLGLVDAGYTYLNLDDAWHSHTRDPQGKLVPDSTRFASGIPHLVQYAQDRGMQLGIYTDAGLLTCAGYPGSLGHEEDDAQTFAEWGIGYLKVDNCWADPASVVDRYSTMGAALNATGHPMVYSLCSWGVGEPWRGWGRRVGGHTWRIDGDISAEWHSVLRCLDSSMGLSAFAGPGGWNDPDMLEVGNGALGLGMQRAHFALWCVLKAPLLVGTDLRHLDTPSGAASLSILLNKELIAINQDELGVAGDIILAEGMLQVWASPLSGGGRAVVILNKQEVPELKAPEVTITWKLLGYADTDQVTVRDLYAGRDLVVSASSSITLSVPSADCLALRLTPHTPSSSMEWWRPWHVNTAVLKQQRAQSGGGSRLQPGSLQAARRRRRGGALGQSQPYAQAQGLSTA